MLQPMRRESDPDTRTIHLVVVLLGVIALVLIIGILGLYAIGKTPDAALLTLAAAAVGNLGAMLSRTSTEKKENGPTSFSRRGKSVGKEIGEGIAEASKDEPVRTQEVTRKQDSVPIGENHP